MAGATELCTMKTHRLSLSTPNFNWYEGDQQEQERLICEALLKMRMQRHDTATFETPNIDPPDVIIRLSDGRSLRAEVTEHVYYERRNRVQSKRLVNNLKKAVQTLGVYPPVPCNIVIGLYPEEKRVISERKLLKQVDAFAETIREFFAETNVSDENRIRRILDGDASITFIPAMGYFKFPPQAYVRNINIECWDGLFLERKSDNISTIILKKDDTLRKALENNGKQCQTDILVIWDTLPVEAMDGIHVQLPPDIQYTGIYYVYITNTKTDYIASLEVIRETSTEHSFFDTTEHTES